VKERWDGNPHHRNRFSRFKANCFETRSAAVPLPHRGGFVSGNLAQKYSKMDKKAFGKRMTRQNRMPK